MKGCKNVGRKRVLTDEERKERRKEYDKKWREKQKAENAEEYKRKNRERSRKWRTENPRKTERDKHVGELRTLRRQSIIQ